MVAVEQQDREIDAWITLGMRAPITRSCTRGAGGSARTRRTGDESPGKDTHEVESTKDAVHARDFAARMWKAYCMSDEREPRKTESPEEASREAVPISGGER